MMPRMVKEEYKWGWDIWRWWIEGESLEEYKKQWLKLEWVVDLKKRKKKRRTRAKGLEFWRKWETVGKCMCTGEK